MNTEFLQGIRIKKIKLQWSGLLPFLFLWIGFILSFYPTLFSGFKSMQSDPGDTLFNNYVLEHGYQWITGNPLHKEFWNAPFYFPEKNVMAYSDILLGSAPLYWAWRLLSFLPDTAFQLWLITLAGLNFFCMYLFLRQGLRFKNLASSMGSFIFAFASSRSLQSHAQLFPHFYTPLLAFSILKAFQEQNSRGRFGWIGFSFFCCVAQIYSGFYLGWFLGLIVLFAFVFGIKFKETRSTVTQFLILNWKSILFWGGIGVLSLAPFVYHSILALKTVSGRSEIFEPKIQSWFYLGSNSWLYSWQSKIRGFQVISDLEQQIGIGFLTLSLVIFGFYQNKKEAWAKILGCTFLVLFFSMTSFYRKVCLWHHIYTWVPGAIGIRALARVGIASLFFASVGLAAFFNERRKIGIGALIAFICVLEQGQFLESFDKFAWRADVSDLASKIAPKCRTFYYAHFIPNQECYSQLTAMWASLSSQIPTLNGYSGNAPPGWGTVLLLKENATESDYKLWAESWLHSRGAPTSNHCLIYSRL